MSGGSETAPPRTRPFECARYPDEVCALCGSYGPFGRGPPMQPAFERRCADHVWDDFFAPLHGPPPRPALSDAIPDAPAPQQPSLFGGRR
ncbi:MAG: hypothetical protein NW200_13930 [Hyphomonadaceae bacterium]|nr:hypothetical protein [Hyphomonadaceae bacterium]